MHQGLVRLTGLLFIISFSASAVALPAYIQDFQSRQQAKKDTRWTITDWFETQQKVSLMDQWLAMNTSGNWVDFYISGGMGGAALRSSSDPSEDASELSFDQFAVGFFITVLGFETQVSRVEADGAVQKSTVSLRLLGSSLQSTSLILKAGYRNQNSEVTGEPSSVNIYGGDLNLYISDYLGVSISGFSYPVSKDQNDNEWFGYYGAAQLFVEAEFLRFGVEYYEEGTSIETATETRNSITSGWLGKVGFYW